jgi:hypothetical protein
VINRVHTSASSQIELPLRPSPVELGPGIKKKNNIWRFWSYKAGGRIVTCYGPWEFENAKRLEEDRDVLAWCEQPLKIPKARKDGTAYVLDFWAYRSCGTQEYGEVKPESEMVESEDGNLEPADWAAVRKAVDRLGGKPVVVSDAYLDDMSYLLSNWDHIIGHVARAYYHDDRALRESILNLIAKRPPISLGEIESYHASSFGDDIRAQTFRLYQEGRVSAPLKDQPVDRCLRFRPTGD